MLNGGWIQTRYLRISSQKLYHFATPADQDGVKTFYNKTSFLEWIKFINEDIKVKHTNKTTFYNAQIKWKVCTKVIKRQAGELGLKEQVV